MARTKNVFHDGPDVVLIGAGVMSATLGILLKELKPELKIEVFERLDIAGSESSEAWNNAGTGHSSFCELNYTPPSPSGAIDILKATKIAESFEVSKEFWSFLMSQQFMPSPLTLLRAFHTTAWFGVKRMWRSSESVTS